MQCPICFNTMTGIKPWKPRLNLLTCSNCGFVTADLNEWKYPYSNLDYYEATEPRAINSERPYINHRINQILKFVCGGRAVDLGCGLGETAIAMSRAGFETHGVEESSNAINFLKKEYKGIHWHNESIIQFLENKRSCFDVISLFHVLEHIPNPAVACRLAASALRSKGLLVVEVPDVSGGQARLRGRNWRHWLPHHVNYFNLSTLRALLIPLGLSYESKEVKYHLGYPQGIWWKDATHCALAQLGMHDIITTYWQKSE
jgi:SAM-dependent methyltransferase